MLVNLIGEKSPNVNQQSAKRQKQNVNRLKSMEDEVVQNIPYKSQVSPRAKFMNTEQKSLQR